MKKLMHWVPPRLYTCDGGARNCTCVSGSTASGTPTSDGACRDGLGDGDVCAAGGGPGVVGLADCVMGPSATGSRDNGCMDGTGDGTAAVGYGGSGDNCSPTGAGIAVAATGGCATGNSAT